MNKRERRLRDAAIRVGALAVLDQAKRLLAGCQPDHGQVPCKVESRLFRTIMTAALDLSKYRLQRHR